MSDGARQLGEAGQQFIKDTIADPWAKFNALPEGAEKNRKRAIWGTGLLTAGLYLAHAQYPYASFAELVRFGVHGFQAPGVYSWPYYAWAAAMLFGLLWLVVGTRGSRGSRQIMAAFWALVRLTVFGAALWHRFLLGSNPSIDPWLQGFYVVVVGSSLMALYVSLRGPGRGASRTIQRFIMGQAKVFRVGRQRSF